MRIKNLLVLALTLLCTGMAQAQIVNETFNAEQTKAATDQGYYEFINLQPTDLIEKADKWTVADGALKIENSTDYPCSGQKWQRAIKFRNLPLKEKTFYKLSFDLTTSETYIDTETSTEAPGYVDMKLMQGDENADICIQGADGSEQRSNEELIASDQPVKFAKVFYFADLAKQNAAYEAACAGKELYDPAKFFACINLYTPGTYVLDNVLLEESSALERVSFYGQAIKVFYGDNINATALLNGKRQYVLDNSCAKVTVDGAEADIVSVEIKSDGYLYIFLDDDYELSEENKVMVSFKAPEELQFTGSFTGASLDFTDVQADVDESINAASWLMDEAALESSVPADGSFALSQSISEFTFTFDKPVYATANNAGGAPEATLSNGETLTLVSTGDENGLTKTLVFQRTSNELLPKGNYTVAVNNIINEYGTAVEGGLQISFEVGKVQLAETVYTDLFTNLLQGANGSQPTGWTIMVGGENWAGGEAKADDGAACRNINITGTNGEQTAFYLCDRAGYTFMQYGDQEGQTITLPKGDIEFSIIAVGHEAASRHIEFRLEDMNGNEIVTGDGYSSVVAGDFTTIEAAGTIPVKFNNPEERNVILKIHEPEGGYTACRVVGFKARSYVVTEGDKADSEILFEEKFASTDDNVVPAEATGWNIYDAGTLLEYGSNGSGKSSRIFSTQFTNLPKAYYCRQMGGSGYYGIYGEQESKPLTLKAGTPQITYYSAGWKASTVNMTFQLLDENNEVVQEKTEVVACNMGGDKTKAGDAQKTQFNLSIPANGNYKLKFIFDGEAMVGNIKIEQMGSKAAYYANLLKTAVAEAQAQLDLCEDAMYDGTTKTAIKEDIAKYSAENDMTTAEEYTAAIAELTTLTKSLKSRAANIKDYNTAVENLSTVLSSTVGTKYEKLDAYKAANEIYSQYGSVNPSTLEDEELAATTLKLQNYYSWINNMYTKGVGLLTKQTDDLAAMLNNEGDASVAKAKESITDDQTLAYILKLKNLKAIYDKCAEGNPFYTQTIDENLVETEIVDSIDVSAFIQNRNIYTTETSNTKNLTDTKNVPGWNIDIKNGSIGLEWSWVTTWAASEYNPINDAFLLNGWYGDFSMDQNVSLLPVGTYRYVSGTQDRGMSDTSADKTAALETMAHWTVTGTDGTNDITGEIFSYIYWMTGEKRDSVAFDITSQGQWYALTDDNSKPIEVNATGDKPYGDLLIGTRAVSYQSSASVDNFKLYMTGKKEGFDYAAAAAAVQKLIDEFEGSEGAVEKTIKSIIDVICGGTATGVEDVNGDGKINVLDINAAISAAVNK